MDDKARETRQVSEKELEQVAGGGPGIENRYDPVICSTISRPVARCYGYTEGLAPGTQIIVCEHYQRYWDQKGRNCDRCLMRRY